MNQVSKNELKCIRYLAQEMSKSEKAVFEIELKIDHELYDTFEKYRMIWEIYPIEKNHLNNKFSSKNNKKNIFFLNNKISKELRFIVVSLVIITSLIGVYYSTKQTVIYSNHITAGNSGYKMILLPDSTKVWLNKNSEIKYPNLFKNTRDVWVFGEVYFDVNHDKNKPFIVHTEHLKINVLGTAFNVNTFTENKTVSLERGNVNIFIKQSSDKLNLHPNEELVFNTESRNITKRNFILKDVLSWKDNSLILDDIPLKTALPKINNYFGTQFYINDKNIANKRITGVFKDKDLSQFINSLEFIMDISIHHLTSNKYIIKTKEDD
ncbi:DUF4974 domain-containing protein [Aureibaculum marinum]|uniref:DUF4974 domain-containing protein n=1 Tax=Aureibaculum marinum TaxID=2487930 RepID=A0A3N4PAX3_9FLAO|nr:FecR domain-containing protein [Aureibaculum marinum]RPD96673.1 DUF4974 domain-containing protein [Aureibaculum marinum]